MERTRWLGNALLDRTLQDKGVARGTMVLSALVVSLVAIWLYQGMLDPRNVDWLANEGDSFQHYIGWSFFRQEPWSWPLGALNSLAYEVPTSVVYTDSIPLYAIPLKLIGGWLPEPFQYLGLAVLLNFCLNGLFASRLLVRLGMAAIPAFLLALIMSTLPMITLRGLGAKGHEALTAHWLLFIGLEYLLLSKGDTYREAVRWLLLLCLSVLVHFYLFFMVGVLWTTWVISALFHSGTREVVARLKNSRGVWCLILASPFLVLFVMWAVGYFYLGGQTAAAAGYGDFTAETLAFFNPALSIWVPEGQWRSLSTLFPGWLPYQAGQAEGQVYAGAGVLLLWAIAIMACCLRAGSRPVWSRARAWALLATLALFLFAMGGVVSFASLGAVRVPYDELAGPLRGYLRASGRMAWPLLYLLIVIAAFAIMSRLGARRFTRLILWLAIIQCVDLNDWNQGIRASVAARLEAAESSPPEYDVWSDEELARIWGERQRIVAFPLRDPMRLRPYVWIMSRYDIPMNISYFARLSYERMEQLAAPHRAALKAGRLSPEAVYLLSDADDVRQACAMANWKCRTYDGLTVAWYDES